jgi:hypothetical protein
VRDVPSFTEPWRLLDPDTKASASTRLVLPLAPCPTTAMFLISLPEYSRMGISFCVWVCQLRIVGVCRSHVGARPEVGGRVTDGQGDKKTRPNPRRDAGRPEVGRPA